MQIRKTRLASLLHHAGAGSLSGQSSYDIISKEHSLKISPTHIDLGHLHHVLVLGSINSGPYFLATSTSWKLCHAQFAKYSHPFIRYIQFQVYIQILKQYSTIATFLSFILSSLHRICTGMIIKKKTK